MADIGELGRAETLLAESWLSAWARPHRAFLILTAIFGLALIVLVPPFQSPDEFTHFLRAYQISQGTFISRRTNSSGLEGDVLPTSFDQVESLFGALPSHPKVKTSLAVIRRGLRIGLNPEIRGFYVFTNTAHNCPTAYLAQCAGITLGRIFNLPPLILLYLGRITNLLAWIVLGFFSLRLAPAIARPMFFLLLMPMSLVLAASVSADPTTIGLAALLTALVCRYFEKPSPSIDRKAMVTLTAISIPLSVSKLAYLPIVGLISLVPARKFGGLGRCTAKLLVLAAINLTAVALWISVSSIGLDTQIRTTHDAFPRLQLQWIEQHPGAIPGLLRNTIHAYGWLGLQSYVGMVGFFDQPLPIPITVGYAILLLLACWPRQPRSPLPSAARAAVVVVPIVVVTTAIIALLSYLYWCYPGMPYIDGLNGRYLIPLTPPILVLLCAAAQRLPARWQGQRPQNALDGAAALISLGVCCYLILINWMRFYG